MCTFLSYFNGFRSRDSFVSSTFSLIFRSEPNDVCRYVSTEFVPLCNTYWTKVESSPYVICIIVEDFLLVVATLLIPYLSHARLFHLAQRDRSYPEGLKLSPQVKIVFKIVFKFFFYNFLTRLG